MAGITKFLSTLSLRRATRAARITPTASRNFYPRSPCGERRDVIAVMTDAQSISIHALLAESDHNRFGRPIDVQYFYPRSPCGERQAKALKVAAHGNFYPRSPCGERRGVSFAQNYYYSYFYPRSPCGERQAVDISARREASISIHALLAESD